MTDQRKRTTILDVAKRANVSISTVSRFLSMPDKVNPIKAIAISDAVRELNYSPDPYAQGMKRKTSNVVGLIIPDISQPFFADACKSMSKVFYQNGFFVNICDTDNDPAKERFYIEDMMNHRAAGIIIATCGGNTEFLDGVTKEYDRVILFDRREPTLAIDAVYEDGFRGAHDLACHMIQKGYKRFAALHGRKNAMIMRERYEGFLAALSEAGLTLDEKMVYSDLPDMPSAEAAVHKLMQPGDRPDCVFAFSPMLLDACSATLMRLKIAVPRDVGLCGFAMENTSLRYPFPVPSVLQNPYLLGLKTSELMLKRIKNKKTSGVKQIELPLVLKTEENAQ